jgi:light-regulated signal transduction histidine kinase (bacteriophytochrome)
LAFQNEEKEKRASELVIANAELVYQNEEKEKRAAELESVNKELESFSYSVAHDLRAPLRAINGNAKILEEDYAGKFDLTGMKSLHSIQYNSKRMGELIDDLLAFSNLGRKQVMSSEINMNALVESVRMELLSDSENKTKFNVNLLPPAKGDLSLIRQVWVNLISNALKYSKYKLSPTIEVEAYSKNNLIVYAVKDNGVGFDMQHYEKLFGVFQRLHSQDQFEGTGIGLAIVQKIVNRHSGTVWAESQLNEGACFYFSLPGISI